MTATNNYPAREMLAATPKTAHASIDTATLVWMIKSKNERGFNMLYDKYCGALYGILLKFVHHTEVANDLLQDVFVKIWKHIDSFNPARGNLFTWMLNIARNQAIDYLRSAQRQQQLAHVDNELYSLHLNNISTPFLSNQMAETKDLQNKAMQLDAKYAEVIDMIFFYGCTHEQTARLLKLPLGTVKTRARKGLEMLKVLYRQ